MLGWYQEQVKDLGKAWMGTTYDLLGRNCNHFSSAFCMRLVGKTIPKWVNRLANTGHGLTDVIGRPEFLGDDPECVRAYTGPTEM